MKRAPNQNNTDDNVALSWAAFHGYITAVENLLKNERANPAADDNDAICLAAQKGHIKIVKRLLKQDCIDKGVNPASE